MLTDKGAEMAIVVYGPGSKVFAQAQAKQNNRNIEKLRKKGKFDQSAEQKAAESAEFLSDCTASFENIDYDKLKDKELFKAVYSDSTLGFIADQVAKYIGDWSNFTTGSTKS
jgi:hypothetical protein